MGPTPDASANHPRRTAPRHTTCRGPRRRPRRAGLRLAAPLATVLLLAGCAGGDDTASDAAGLPSFAPAPAMPQPGADAGRAEAGGTVGTGIVGDRVAEGRAVVRTASLELVVDDGARAIDAVADRAAALGGHVASTTRSRDEDGTVSGSLVLRVPSDRLDELVDALDALARAVPFRSVDEVDVTLELSDIDAQLVNLRAFEDELRTLLSEVRERDGTVEGLVAVSDRLRQVRTEIDVVEGRRIQLADRVALSTVHVFVRQARSATPVVGTWDLPGVVRDALAATVRLAQLVVEGAVWTVVTVLPAAVVVGAGALGVRALRRRRRTRGLAG